MSFLRDFGLPELLIILVIIVILFGPGRIGKVAGELGKGIRAFRDGLKPNGEDKDDTKDHKKPKRASNDRSSPLKPRKKKNNPATQWSTRALHPVWGWHFIL